MLRLSQEESAMDIEYAKEFLVLAETLNFSKAAQELFTSQPTLSRHMKLLEKELGFQLLKTSSHGVSMTPSGEDAVRSFSKIVREYDNFCERGRKLSTSVTGKLKVGLLYYSVEDYFSDFIPDFKANYPDLTLEVISYQPHQLYEDLIKGKIDVGQIVSTGPDDSSLNYLRLLDTSLLVIMENNNPLADKETVTLKELKGETLIELTEDEFSADLTRSILEKNKITFKKTISTETIETVPYMIRKTKGIHITGESVRKQSGKNLSYVTISDRRAKVGIYLASLKSNQNELISLFLQEAKQFFVK